MTIMCKLQHKIGRRMLVAALLVLTPSLPSWSAPAKTTPLPANSVYQLSVPFTDQQGRTSTLEDWRGKPVMISMFYSSCQFVCPRIVEALKRTGESLAAQGAQLPVLMVTFDPARDDTAALKAMAEERHIDSRLWTLAHENIVGAARGGRIHHFKANARGTKRSQDRCKWELKFCARTENDKLRL